MCGLVNKVKLVYNFSSYFDVLLTVLHLSIFISVINQLDAQNFCFTISLFHASTCFEHMCSKHISCDYVPIIRRNNCILATLGICRYVWVTVWFALCKPDSHPYRITNIKCRINTVVYPDDGTYLPETFRKKK